MYQCKGGMAFSMSRVVVVVRKAMLLCDRERVSLCHVTCLDTCRTSPLRPSWTGCRRSVLSLEAAAGESSALEVDCNPWTLFSSNAITLERLTSNYPKAGSLITFAQFLLISLFGLRQHIVWTDHGPRLRPRRVKLAIYCAQVVLHFLISMLNNAAFAYRIPMAVHIIFRSAGLVITMILGYVITGKRFVPQFFCLLYDH